MKNHRFPFLHLNLVEFIALLMKPLGQRKSFKSQKDLEFCKQHFKRDYSNTKKILLFRISKKGLIDAEEESRAVRC